VTSPYLGIVVVVAVLAASTAFGLVRRRRDGRVRQSAESTDLGSLGFAFGAPVTLLQFSSEYCAPCRATSALCASIVATRPDVAHVEIDAADHLAAVRALDIRRTPTLLVVDARGRVRSRAVGRPDRDELLAAVGSAV
jgi:thiol-disulfide isomerase/thioredoxin